VCPLSCAKLLIEKWITNWGTQETGKFCPQWSIKTKIGEEMTTGQWRHTISKLTNPGNREHSDSATWDLMLLWQWQSWRKYEGCLDSNASYFIILVHDVRGGCWWYGSRGWTFLLICVSVVAGQQQQRGSLANWCLTWKWIRSRGVSLNSLTFNNAWWTFTETKQWMWAQWPQWCERQDIFWEAQHGYQLTKWRAPR
jgi:hypothetical protein